MGHVNIIDNICVYTIKVLFIKILVGRLKINLTDGLKIENDVNNLPAGTNPNFTDILLKTIIRKIEIDKFKVFSSLGAKNDAFLTAMAAGSVSTIFACLSAIILEYNPNATITRAVSPTFNENSAEITIVASFKINILNIIISLIKAKKKFKIKFKGEHA